MLPAELKEFSKSLGAVAVFASNILFSRESGYFDTGAELKPLLHTWSLAVEEQYYLLFPVLVLVTWSFGKRKLIAILSILACASLLIAQIHSQQLRTGHFYLLTTRGWELLIGALIALILYREGESNSEKAANDLLNEVGSIAGLCLIGYSIFAFDENTPFPSVYTLIPTVGTALIITFSTDQTAVGRILGNRWLVALGLISYSGYLWHQPLLAFARLYATEELSSPVLLLLIWATFSLAYLTWRFVEQPFRNRKTVGSRPFLLCAGTMSVAMLAIGVAGYVKDGFADHFYSTLPAETRINFELIAQHTGRNLYLDMPDNGECMFWQKAIDEQFIARFESCKKRYGKALFVLGDSHAMNIFGALFRSDAGRFLVGLSEGGCRPHTDLANCPYKAFRKFADQNFRAIEMVIYHQAGSYLLADPNGKVNSNAIFHGKNKGQYEIYFENIKRTADYLESLPAKIRIVWLGPYVEPRVSFQNLREIRKNSFLINEQILKIFEDLDKKLLEYIASSSYRFTYISAVQQIKLGTETQLKMGNCITFRDHDHFSICGEALIGAKIRESITPFLENKGHSHYGP